MFVPGTIDTMRSKFGKKIPCNFLQGILIVLNQPRTMA